MKTVFLLILTLLVSLSAMTARAESPDEALREKIAEAIKEPSSVVNTSWWLALGPDAPGAIVAMFKSEQHNYQRTKLVEALANYKDDPAALSFLKEQATAGVAAPVRYAAIRSVGRCAGTRETEFLGGLLKDADPHARLEAAEALQRLGDPATDKVVREYMAKEDTAWVVARLKKKAQARSTTRYEVKRK